ncbi:SPOR domain-containing protein [Caenispirillum bisanense]|uniref:SPOR domain-containing protein n=1 Tax=Caenispirillum bisanense TaxID=414052 RepID=UPI0031DCD189
MRTLFRTVATLSLVLLAAACASLGGPGPESIAAAEKAWFEGTPEEFAARLSEARKYSPVDGRTLLLTALNYHRRGNHDVARQYYEAIILRRPATLTTIGSDRERSVVAAAYDNLSRLNAGEPPLHGVAPTGRPVAVRAASPVTSGTMPVAASTSDGHGTEASAGPAAAALAAEPEGSVTPVRSEGVEDYGLHIASLRDPALAERTWNDLSRRVRGLAALDHRAEVVDLPAKGRFHRLIAGPTTREDADRICRAMQEMRLYCVTTRF